MSDWRDRIVGARMTVDQEFGSRVQRSEFTRQQWGLVMTAVEFEVEAADDPERARIVADTSNLPAVMDELDQVGREAPGMGGGGRRDAGGGGLFAGVKRLLGLGGGGGGGGADAETRRAAEELAQEYAAELQAHLESEGRWEEVRTAAAGG